MKLFFNNYTYFHCIDKNAPILGEGGECIKADIAHCPVSGVAKSQKCVIIINGSSKKQTIPYHLTHNNQVIRRI